LLRLLRLPRDLRLPPVCAIVDEFADELFTFFAELFLTLAELFFVLVTELFLTLAELFLVLVTELFATGAATGSGADAELPIVYYHRSIL
jgi:hypothetical protein